MPGTSEILEALKILLVTSSVNPLCTRAQIQLSNRGHEIAIHAVEPGCSDASLIAAVDAARPDLIVAPTLKRILPEAIWRRVPCLIVHPGVRGDRGMSSLDWAIENGERTWGVTLIQAAAEVDSGDIWAWREFPMRAAKKTSLFRHEVSDAALECIFEAVDAFAAGRRTGHQLAPGEGRGQFRPAMKQADRAIDWERDVTETVLRKIRAADTAPGVVDRLFGDEVLLFGAHEEATLRAAAGTRPGEVFAQRHGAICRATCDGAVWITHLRPRGKRQLKLPAANVVGDHLHSIPEVTSSWHDPAPPTWRDIWYEEHDDVGLIHFDVYNGALSTEQCIRLRHALAWARNRPTKTIVLLGGTDFFCNGIHLSLIESAQSVARASWDNILAIDDLVQDLIETTSHIVISSLAGDAAAGGVMLALAADRIHARPGVVMNPHYRALELFGSGFWTYLLPRRTGEAAASVLIEEGQPVESSAARSLGLIDDTLGTNLESHREQVLAEAHRLARDAAPLLADKQARRARDEATRPLAAYREDELHRMRMIFDDPSSPYHRRRRRFLLGVTAPPPIDT